MRRTLQVKVYHNNKNRIIVPQDEYFRVKDAVYIQHGFKKVACDVLSHNQNQRTIYLSSSIVKQIKLQNQSQVVIEKQENTCSIYYLFGVFIHCQPNQLKNEPLFQEMARIGYTLGYETILFSYQQIHYSSNTITGAILRDEEWKSTEVDTPTVIYNRIPNRIIENHPMTKKAKKYLSKTSFIFNSNFLNKWHVYEKLKNSPEVSYLLPDTIFHPSLNTIKQTLQQHAIFLKPFQAKKQRNTFYIEKVDDLFFVTTLSPQVEHVYVENIELFYQETFPSGSDHYVLLDAIKHKEYKGKSFHFRVHTLKDQNNEWQVVLQYVEELSDNSERSIISANSLFNKREAAIMSKKVSEIAIKVSYQLENSINERIAELGLDIALDNENRLWLEEVYAKPSWDVFYHPSMASQAHNYFSYLLQWSLFLMKKS